MQPLHSNCHTFEPCFPLFVVYKLICLYRISMWYTSTFPTVYMNQEEENNVLSAQLTFQEACWFGTKHLSNKRH